MKITTVAGEQDLRNHLKLIRRGRKHRIILRKNVNAREWDYAKRSGLFHEISVIIACPPPNGIHKFTKSLEYNSSSNNPDSFGNTIESVALFYMLLYSNYYTTEPSEIDLIIEKNQKIEEFCIRHEATYTELPYKISSKLPFHFTIEIQRYWLNRTDHALFILTL